MLCFQVFLAAAIMQSLALPRDLVNVVQGCLRVKVHIRFNRADTRRTDSVFSLLHVSWLACAFSFNTILMSIKSHEK